MELRAFDAYLDGRGLLADLVAPAYTCVLWRPDETFVQGEGRTIAQAVESALRAMDRFERRTGRRLALERNVSARETLEDLDRALSERGLVLHVRAVGTEPPYYTAFTTDELGRPSRSVDRPLFSEAATAALEAGVGPTLGELEREIGTGFPEPVERRARLTREEAVELVKEHGDVALAARIVGVPRDVFERVLLAGGGPGLRPTPAQIEEARRAYGSLQAVADVWGVPRSTLRYWLEAPAAVRQRLGPDAAAELVEMHGSISGAARAWGVPYSTLRSWLPTGFRLEPEPVARAPKPRTLPLGRALGRSEAARAVERHGSVAAAARAYGVPRERLEAWLGLEPEEARALVREHGSIRAAAEAAGVARTTFRGWLEG